MTRAAVIRAKNAPVEISEVNLEDPKPGEVRVTLSASGVCHSDLSLLNDTIPLPPPIIAGHEGAGIIDAVGEGVTSVKPGDHVVISWVPQCGHCFACTRGQGYLCETSQLANMMGTQLDLTTRFSDPDGTPIVCMAGAGTFAEQTVVHESAVVKIDPEMPLDKAALIGCGVLTGYGAAVNTASIREGDIVAVIGCGGVGLNAIQGAVHQGASKVVAIDTMANKLEMAKVFGATDTINASEVNAVEALQGISEGRGADVVLEVVGIVPTIRQAIDMARRGGEIVLVGLPSIDALMEFSPAMDSIVAAKTLKGCWYGSSNVQEDVPKLVDAYMNGTLKLDELVSRRITLDEVDEAFEAMGTGEVARSVIIY
ncbi:MAG: Zn-dependent alcohol dehydrogenase [Acidimicrobiia bacterium]|jgi:NDMA-dependent alcohol dehydrogenase|nr:Zn-dependent alcohol dehydrogenase [Acidimicrobiia bacterium]MBP8180683.1 Zn-dependent alcohol dehydrogenase [Acidimicrobiia bacterium]